MTDHKAELEARLMAAPRAEAAVEQMLDQAVPAGQESLADIKPLAQTAGHRELDAKRPEAGCGGRAETAKVAAKRCQHPGLGLRALY
jgi:hypothetical protein